MKVTGLDKKIKGSLLTSHFDLENAIGFAYERCISYAADFHEHSEHMFVFPRSSAKIEFVTKNPHEQTHAVSEKELLWMPKNTLHSQRALTTIWDNFAIYVDDQFLFDLITKHNLSKEVLQRFQKETITIERTTFINELQNELFLQKVMKSATFKDIKVLSEMVVENSLLALVNQCSKPDLIIKRDTNNYIQNAVDFIEQNLFSDFSSADLSAHCGMSVSTLFRHFKKEFKMTPFEYVRVRKLEEAKILLDKGGQSVENVAYLVGYNDFSAFSKAFKKHYSVNPSTLLNVK